jgi:hypothetical protein
MTYREFIKGSGFKMLAVARLAQSEYGVVLYVLNCAASGLDEIETSPPELALTLGYEVREVQDALNGLAERGILVVGSLRPGAARVPSGMRLSMQYDTSRWQIAPASTIDHVDALVFPFRRHATVHVMSHRKQDVNSDATWKRVFDSFASGRILDKDEKSRAERDSRILADTHSVDEILLMLRHFGDKVPSLSLLASSWSQFQQLFEEETNKVDLAGARQKNFEMDAKVRTAAADALDKKSDLGLSDEEATALQVIANHRYPRRQLFWAYQMRTRYPKLASFFSSHEDVMLGVTTKGFVLKRPKDGQ